jgi:hypothetical protein
MLQIISGKFFKSDDCYSGKKRGITYSNYNWVNPIETCVATLEPVDQYWSSSASYVISYVNKIEKKKAGPIRETGNAEIIQQFQLLCIFGLKAFFNTERNVVETHCRKQPKNLSDNNVPSWFVSRFFEPSISGNSNEISYFKDFVKKVIGMPRKSYLSTIKCLKNFSDALQIINYNIDLAYSMMVYCLESLSQEFDNFEPYWNDFEPKIKNNLDKLLSEIPQNIAKDIRDTLLKSSHLKLQKRFSDFIRQHISDDFFVEEAKES